MRSIVYATNLLLLTIVALVSGCAGDLDQGYRTGYLTVPSIWIRSARSHVKEGDLQRALYEYRIAYTLSHHDQEIEQEIKQLQQKILNETNALIRSAQKAKRQGKIDRSRKHYLKILSLNPRHKEALKALRTLDESMIKQVLQRRSTSKRLVRKAPPSDRKYIEEGYVYSRQAILQADNRAKNVSNFIKELEAHVAKYPYDDEVKEMLLETRIVQAKAAFERADYDKSLQHLQRAEKALMGDKKLLDIILNMRKTFAKMLYSAGVRRIRDDHDSAVKLWKRALKFHPQNKKIQIRIQNSEKK